MLYFYSTYYGRRVPPQIHMLKFKSPVPKNVTLFRFFYKPRNANISQQLLEARGQA